MVRHSKQNRKQLRAKSGKVQKKGLKGEAASYMTRNQAIRKLQITLKDFRRLCILKGIYPRDPKKKKNGKGKTYYHCKDIKFLAHEPLLVKFRALKTFLKKKKKAKIKMDRGKLKKLTRHRPRLFVDHLIKERYPAFSQALRDLDDALCMVHLFATLPVKTTRNHSPGIPANCVRLCREWQHYVYRSHSLRKVFVSIKGIYYRAHIQGADITWLVPHMFKPRISKDVDYRVMLTFLQFYQSMAKFVNFKLFHDMGLHYPPTTDAYKDAQRAGLSALTIKSIQQQEEEDKAKEARRQAKEQRQASEEAGVTAAPALQHSIDSVVAKLADTDSSAAMELGEEAAEALEKQRKEEKLLQDIRQATEEEEETDKDKVRLSKLFKGLVFLISRECPQDSLEFVVLCGGGKVIRQASLQPEQEYDSAITHQVVDRPTVQRRVVAREYIQPQWVYDSFNTQALLPTPPYAVGGKLPPHLSPFVDDDAEGYVPRQAEVLKQWGAVARGAAVVPLSVEGQAKKAEEGEEGLDEEEEEARRKKAEEDFQTDLDKERAGMMYSEVKEEADEEEEDEEEDDEEEDDEEEEADEEEVVMAAEEEPTEDLSKLSAKERREKEELALRKIMMGRKAARLYSKIKYGQKQKADKVAKLTARRQALEEPPAPTKKRSGSKASRKASKKRKLK